MNKVRTPGSLSAAKIDGTLMTEATAAPNKALEGKENLLKRGTDMQTRAMIMAAGVEILSASMPALVPPVLANAMVCQTVMMSAEATALAIIALKPFLTPENCRGTRNRGMNATVLYSTAESAPIKAGVEYRLSRASSNTIFVSLLGHVRNVRQGTCALDANGE